MHWIRNAYVFGLVICGMTILTVAPRSGYSQFTDLDADEGALPSVPEGFVVELFAQEPLVRQPCAMTFDLRGRLFVGMGPQYRNPKPETPGDEVVILLDTDGDGNAETTKVFAKGFNAIQGLAWVDKALWIANAPDLTVVRDVDGDDVADEYVRLYTDLGNLEHGLHGLNVGPDGKVYMSKGNSKGLTEGTRLAPKPFRELWGVDAPSGAPDFPGAVVFNADNYERNYHDPSDDWGLDGGILRCNPDGSKLEIVCRGFRNPWDITFNSGFDWIGTDNDQISGDRVFMSIPGGHFGWNHPWSSHWSDTPHLPTAPVSGPLWEGSGTGVIYYGEGPFPERYRNAFFINDWLGKVTYLWRPSWDGALMRPEGGKWQPFIVGGSSLYRPTDLEVGPDGALWILGWSRGYGAEWDNGQFISEGRVFRISYRGGASESVEPQKDRFSSRFEQPLNQWSFEAIIESLDSPVAVQRTSAQEELIRRGEATLQRFQPLMQSGRLSQTQETWLPWALGRIQPESESLDEPFLDFLRDDSAASLNLRIQSIRILAYRLAERGYRSSQDQSDTAGQLGRQLLSSEARLRFEAVQAISQIRDTTAVDRLIAAIEVEEDSTTFYVAWKTLGKITSSQQRRDLLQKSHPRVRLACLLSLLEENQLSSDEVRRFVEDTDEGIRKIASLWLEKIGDAKPVVRGRALGQPMAKVGPREPMQSEVSTSTGKACFAIAAQKSSHQYRVMPEGLRSGGRVYSDREYVFRNIPGEFQGSDFVQTSNDDDGSRGDDWLRLDIHLPSRIVVAIDTRQSQHPRWLTSHFEKLPQQIEADHWTFDLYARDASPGTIVLGGNTDNGIPGGKGNYVVLVQPLPFVETNKAVPIEDVIPLVESGDVRRGEALFAHRNGIGCYRCHLSDDPNNRLAPSLENIATRTTVEHLIRSILEPSAVITEGFNLQVVVTENGQVFSGVLVEESGATLTLGQSDGELITIRKDTIEIRRTEKRSAMPTFASLLTAQQVADLVAYLRQPAQTSDGDQTIGEMPVAPKVKDLGIFRVTRFQDRLVLESEEQSIGEFVFGDNAIKRPYFANLRSPSGIKVTRNYPPDPSLDATDHASMHPGLWYGFGDISGEDFWRNRASIRHLKFIEEPSLDDQMLRFSTLSDLVSESGKKLGIATNRVSIEPMEAAWMVIWEIEIQADEGPLVFGDQEEMGFGARVATPITEKAGGRLTSSQGLASAADTWGKAADWCDYSGVQDDKSYGITLLVSPKNFQPSWWHNRDYGVFVANAFGRAAMKQGKPQSITIEKGKRLVLGYAAVIHDGHDYSPSEAMSRYKQLLDR